MQHINESSHLDYFRFIVDTLDGDYEYLFEILQHDILEGDFEVPKEPYIPYADILRDDTYRVMIYHQERFYQICVLKVLKVAGKQFHLGVHLLIKGSKGYLKVGCFHENMFLKGYGFSKCVIFSSYFLPGKLA